MGWLENSVIFLGLMIYGRNSFFHVDWIFLKSIFYEFMTFKCVEIFDNVINLVLENSLKLSWKYVWANSNEILIGLCKAGLINNCNFWTKICFWVLNWNLKINEGFQKARVIILGFLKTLLASCASLPQKFSLKRSINPHQRDFFRKKIPCKKFLIQFPVKNFPSTSCWII